MTKATRWALAAVGTLAGLQAGDAGAQIGQIQRVTASSAFDSSDFKQVVVQCPPGTVAFSGGASLNGDQGLPVIVHQSLPQGDPPSGWLAVAQEHLSTASSWGVVATALCAEIDGYELAEESTPFDDTNSKSIDADCPPGKVPIGGGGGIFLFTPDHALRALEPTATGWRATAYTPASASWFLSVRVGCAPPLRLEEFAVRTQNLAENRDDLLLSCPDGWIALAGGAEVVGSGTPREALYMTRPSLDPGWEVGGRRVSGGSQWNLSGSVLCLAPTLFADGFESGDTEAWSGTVG